MTFSRNPGCGIMPFSGANGFSCTSQAHGCTRDCSCFPRPGGSCFPTPELCPPSCRCACIPIPTPEQNGNVLTAVDGRYEPLPLPASAADFEGQMRPSDAGLTAWTYDPMFLETAVTQNGFIYLTKVFIHQTMTVSHILFAGMSDGVLIPGESFVGIYSNAGTRIVQAPLNPPLNTMGFLSSPIPATTLPPGAYFIAFLFNVASGNFNAWARNSCAYQELFTGFNARALQTAANTYTALPAQFAVADFEDFTCLQLWAGLA